MTEHKPGIELEGESPLEWVRNSLRDGGKISQFCLSKFERNAWSARVLVPDGLARDRLYDFKHGGVASTKASEESLALEIARYRGKRNFILLIEDDVRNVGAPALKKFEGSYFSLGTKVVHWSFISSRPDAEIVHLIRNASTGYPLNAFITEMSGDFNSLRSEILRWDRMAESNLKFVAIIVSAYDAESFLICEAK